MNGTWAVAVFAVAVTAVPIGFNLTRLPATAPAPRGSYPIRLELPAARPAAGVAAAPAIEFDIADDGAAGDGGSPVEIRKAVRLNGADAGSATIRVSASSTLAISTDELRALLARAGRGDLAGQIGADESGAGRFIGFEEMRRQGIDVRYDGAADVVMIAA